MKVGFFAAVFLPMLVLSACVIQEAIYVAEPWEAAERPPFKKVAACAHSSLSQADRDRIQRESLRPSSAENWTVVDEETVRVVGLLDRKSEKYFAETVKKLANFRHLIVNSSGGDALGGIYLGFSLLRYRPRITVAGICASSCANYLYTAAGEKHIEAGFVGFHGNVTAMLRPYGLGFKPLLEEVKLQSQKALAQAPELAALQGAEREALISREVGRSMQVFQQDMQQMLRLEKAFFEHLHIDQALFDLSQTPDKGSGLEQIFHLLIPSQALQARFGIEQVYGAERQDLCLARNGGKAIIFW